MKKKECQGFLDFSQLRCYRPGGVNQNAFQNGWFANCFGEEVDLKPAAQKSESEAAPKYG